MVVKSGPRGAGQRPFFLGTQGWYHELLYLLAHNQGPICALGPVMVLLGMWHVCLSVLLLKPRGELRYTLFRPRSAYSYLFFFFPLSLFIRGYSPPPFPFFLFFSFALPLSFPFFPAPSSSSPLAHYFPVLREGIFGERAVRTGLSRLLLLLTLSDPVPPSPQSQAKILWFLPEENKNRCFRR